MSSANNATALGRELWPQKSIDLNMLDGSPVFGLGEQEEDFGEDIEHHYVNYSGAQGLSTRFDIAKADKNAAKRVRFDISTRSYYGNFSVDGQVWRRYKYTGNKGLVMDEVSRNAETIMQQAKNDLSTYIHGDGVGVLARLTSGSTTSSDTCTLTLEADARRLAEGMIIELESTGATGGTVRSGTLEIESIQGTDSAPTVTVVEAGWTTGIAAAAASDYVYRHGTYDNVIYGLAGWLPYWLGSTPGTFLGATRNLAPKKTAGDVLDGTAMDPLTYLFRAARKVADNGFKPDLALMSTRNWEQLHTQLSSAGKLLMTKEPASKVRGFSFGVEYEAIGFMGPKGIVKVVADPWMPDNRVRVGVRNTIKIRSTGPMLHWDDGSKPSDGRVEDAQDAREVRLVGDIATKIVNPFAWCTVSVTA